MNPCGLTVRHPPPPRFQPMRALSGRPTAGRLRHLATGVSGRVRRAGPRGCTGRGVDVDDLGAARGPRNQADGTAADAERPGHRRQCRLGRLAVHGPRADPDDQGAVVLTADTRTCRAGLHPDSDPHAASIDVQFRPGRLWSDQDGGSQPTTQRPRTAVMYRIKPLQSRPFEACRNGRSAARCGVLLRIDTGAGGASGRARL